MPFHREYVEHSIPSDVGGIDGKAKKTISGWISIIYKALRSGDLHRPIMECIRGKVTLLLTSIRHTPGKTQQGKEFHYSIRLE